MGKGEQGMAKRIKVQKLTAEAFRKYGKLIVLQPDQKPFTDNPNLIYWDKVVEFEPDIPRKMELLQMERHCKALEWFVPVAGTSVACFAEYRNPDDPNETPVPDTVVAFKMENIAGFVVNRGAWHWPAFPIGKTATQLIDLRRDTECDDVDVKDLPEPIEIAL
jgi:ureidoglycolate lyase